LAFVSPKIGFWVLLATVLAVASGARATLIGPTAYTGFAGSPFDGTSFSSWSLEDFEDADLDGGPNVTASSGFVLGPGFGLTDSVENAPDGCNPSGLGGGAHSCAGYSYYPSATTITFTFSGTFPTHAGIVWTDVGFVDGDSPPTYTGSGNVIFEAFDESGFSLGTIGPTLLGDGAAAPTAAEDRFFGATNPSGISKITLSMPTSSDWEVDHLQYGVEAEAPEPGAVALLALGFLALAARVRSRA
jgi:hypothetical protein